MRLFESPGKFLAEKEMHTGVLQVIEHCISKVCSVLEKKLDSYGTCDFFVHLRFMWLNRVLFTSELLCQHLKINQWMPISLQFEASPEEPGKLGMLSSDWPVRKSQCPLPGRCGTPIL